jgi:hypothetical protein
LQRRLPRHFRFVVYLLFTYWLQFFQVPLFVIPSLKSVRFFKKAIPDASKTWQCIFISGRSVRCIRRTSAYVKDKQEGWKIQGWQWENWEYSLLSEIRNRYPPRIQIFLLTTDPNMFVRSMHLGVHELAWLWSRCLCGNKF